MFHGPIIVKLHGSPSLELESRLRHWIVLSEFSYLQALGTSARAPYWLEQQLSLKNISAEWDSRGGMGRSLWFLGSSISDWNVRLRLYEDLRRGGRRSSVNQGIDVYRSAILDGLGVEQHIGDLNYLPGMILEILANDLLSDSVTQLVARLKDHLVR